jgi:uncharacterized protein YxeA
MKAILVGIAVILVAIILGWITFNKSPDKAEFSIETTKIKHDAEKVIEKGKAALDNAEKKGKEILHQR